MLVSFSQTESMEYIKSLQDAAISAFAKTVNGAEVAQRFMNKYPKTATAAKIAPFVLVGGYLLKQSVNESFNELEETFAYLHALKNNGVVPPDATTYQKLASSIEPAMINIMRATAVKIMTKIQNQIQTCNELKTKKVPGSLGIERDYVYTDDSFNLEGFNVFGLDSFPALKSDWKTFLTAATWHDNSSDFDAFGSDVVVAFNRVYLHLNLIEDILKRAQSEIISE